MRQLGRTGQVLMNLHGRSGHDSPAMVYVFHAGKPPLESSPRPFDLGRRDRDAVPFLKDLVRWDRLSVDADQVVLWFAALDLLREQIADSESRVDLDVIGKTSSVVVDDQHFHAMTPRERKRSKRKHPPRAGDRRPIAALWRKGLLPSAKNHPAYRRGSTG